ncbi:MAG: CHRD domain-containing protein [bacterium]
MKHGILCGLVTSAVAALASSAFALTPMSAVLDGAQETPPNGSAGTGLGRIVVDTSTHTMFYYFEFSGLGAPETAAHIHGFAPPGVAAGVLQPLSLGSPKIGAWAYGAANEANVLAGLTYVNVHSSAFPGGEIRGQILVDPTPNMVAILQGTQETPPNASPAQGIGFFNLDLGLNTLSIDIHFAGLTATETAAHIHGFAPPGMAAGVLFPLPLGNPKTTVWNFPAADGPSILAGLTYANIHTSTFGGGEIRGQILATSAATTGAPVIPTHVATMSLVAAPNPVRVGGGNVALFYAIPAAGDMDITIHDVAGRVVKTVHHGHAEANGIFAWDTRDDRGATVASGVYFARLVSAGRVETRTITVLK